MTLDDYNSWEQNVSAEDLKQVREGLQNNSGMFFTYLYPGHLQFMLDSGVENDSTEEMDGKSGNSNYSSCEFKVNFNRLAALG